jgi:mannose-6-phosphate isomerase-like protein (cupin superfamily)
MAGKEPEEETFGPDLLGLLESSDPAMAPSAGLRGRLLATIGPERRFEGFVQRAAELFDLPAERIREVFERVASVSGSPWVDGPSGVRLYHFDMGPALAGAHSGLVYIPTGGSFPEHGHVGDEIAFVLQGRLVEVDGDSWAAGDVALRPAGSRHALRCGGNEPVVFVAAVMGGIDIELPDADPTRG